jgi:hypothetical protein
MLITEAVAQLCLKPQPQQQPQHAKDNQHVQTDKKVKLSPSGDGGAPAIEGGAVPEPSPAAGMVGMEPQYAASDGEEWSEDEMKFMQAALEQVRVCSKGGSLPAKRRPPPPGVCACCCLMLAACVHEQACPCFFVDACI